LRSLELFTNEKQLQMNILDSARPIAARFFEWCATFLPSLAPGAIEYAAAGHTLRISRGSFFQVNRFLMDSLIEEVLREASGDHAVDLYAGVGLFSLPTAQHFSRVDAIERSAPAYRDLEWNAHQSASNIQAVKSFAERFLATLGTTPELVIADPPRAGLGLEVTGQLLELKPPRLTIVSCDPSTLARDLHKLLGSYRITRLALLDLFPQTFHFETVLHLELS
jgi:23S rRNA (uracil1939-C5)-methyltransferase